MKKKAITWGVRLGSISMAVGLAAYMSAHEDGQQGVSVNNVQQNDTSSSQQDDTLTPQNGQTENDQQFGGRQGHYRSDSFDEQPSEDEQFDDQYSGNDQSGITSQYGDDSQSGSDIQPNSHGFDTTTGGS